LTPEQWTKVNSVWHAVLARAEGERAAAVVDLCAGDDTLRSDVESLLAHRAHASDAGFLSPAALSAVGRESLIGRFGQYAIQALIGAGGMGEVYRAHDTTLDRDVAIKIVPYLWLADPDRRVRFDREARLLAALNHANIGAIYGIEEHDGIRGLVLELVEGETLAERIDKYAKRRSERRGLPVTDALGIALQIADALEAAHERGIVHRDLKPTNIKITPEGRAKILDFGLGTAAREGESGPVLADNGPLKITGTRAGAVLGTVPYMSPEQARGEPVDRRTDIWAFGCVLYEILTGGRAFDGEDATEILSRVLQQDPDFTTLPADTPPIVRRMVQRCLERDRGKRLPHIAIARFQIEEAMAAPSTSADAPVRVSGHRFKQTLVLGLVIGTLAGLTIAWLGTPRETPAASPVTRLLLGVTPAEQIGGTEGRPTRPAFAVSPNGRTLVFSAVRANQRALYLRHLEQTDALPIPGTDGAESPFFSPDGRWVAYWVGGEIRKVPLTGEPAVRVSEAPQVFGASWGDDDRIVFSRAAGGLWEVPAAGGTPQALTVVNSERGELSHRLPHVLPGGDAILFTSTKHRFPRWDQTLISVYSRRTGVSKVLVEGGADARYVSTGHLVYVMEGVLFAAPFDLQRLEITGGPIGVVPDVMQAAYFRGQNADTGAAQFTISTTGTLVYLPGGIFRPAERSVVWVDRTGRSEPLPIAPRAFVTLRLSPDGQQIALSTFGRERDIWVYAPQRGTLSKLAAPGRNGVPIWTRNGERITYAAGTSGPDKLQWVRADSGGSSELLIHSEFNLVPGTWTPDGRQLLYYRETAGPTTNRPSTSVSSAPWIWVQDAAMKKPPTPIEGPMANAGGAELSSDGRWLAYHSTESGQLQVYVQAYPGPGRRYQVSADGGISPIWRADGRELFYVQPNVQTPPLGPIEARMMAVPVATQSAFTFGVPKELFAGRYEMNSPARAYDATADGQRFLLIQARERPPELITQMTVVQNWFEELKRLVPGN
jgi:serine/threonine-protein kinase